MKLFLFIPSEYHGKKVRVVDQLDSSNKIRRESTRGSDPAAAGQGQEGERAMDEKVVIDVPAPLLVTSSTEKKKKVVEELFKWAWFPLPVNSSSMDKKKNKSSGFLMPLLSVKGVLAWALVTAAIVAVLLGITAAMAFANVPIPCSENSKILQCPDLTPALGVEVESFGDGFLWLTVPQAAAAMVGLLLPHRHARCRWSLAFIAIVSATVAYYMNVRMVFVFIAANPEDIMYGILTGGGAVVYLLLDLLGLLSLIIQGDE